MEMQSVCAGFHAPNLRLSSRDMALQSPPGSSRACFNKPSFLLGGASKLSLASCLRSRLKGSLSLGPKRRGIVCTSLSNSSEQKVPRDAFSSVPLSNYSGVEPFRGKSGSISFYGLTHQLVEEGKLVSAPFQKDKDSFLWLLAPIALISSLILPQFLLNNAIEAWLKNDTLVEIAATLCFESIFYAGVATFLSLTNHVQRPYLHFSPKRWSLITGLRGYLTSAFLTMGLKVVVPIFALYMTWPVLGLDALTAVLPFLVGCAVQRMFEASLEKQESSCWPVIPIIFEVYRLYQLTRAASFIQRLMFLMKDAASSREVGERGVALIGMVVMFQILAVVCLWSLVTFLLRLFPSRPVAENY